MAAITYYVVVPFEQAEDGEFIMREPVEARSADAARSRVRILASAGNGGVAFSRSGDPELGDFKDGQILAALGSLPANLDEYLS